LKSKLLAIKRALVKMNFVPPWVGIKTGGGIIEESKAGRDFLRALAGFPPIQGVVQIVSLRKVGAGHRANRPGCK
jgi:hypothetical protein